MLHTTYLDNDYCLHTGERIVWFGDQGTYPGTVHWIGVLPDSSDQEWTVGVEFVSFAIRCSKCAFPLSCKNIKKNVLHDLSEFRLYIFM